MPLFMTFFHQKKSKPQLTSPLTPRTLVLHNVNDGRVMQMGQIVCIGRATLTSTTPRPQARSERSRSPNYTYYLARLHHAAVSTQNTTT